MSGLDRVSKTTYTDNGPVSGVMQPGKNLHAFVSPVLLSKIEQAARDENLTLDAFVADAMERRVRSRDFEDMLAFGKRHAAARGLVPGDVEEVIAEVRAGTEPRP